MSSAAISRSSWNALPLGTSFSRSSWFGACSERARATLGRSSASFRILRPDNGLKAASRASQEERQLPHPRWTAHLGMTPTVEMVTCLGAIWNTRVSIIISAATLTLS